jgi:hypothetical protein
MVRGQVITKIRLAGNGMPYSEVVDLDHKALWADIDGLGIRDRAGTFEKVLTVFHHFQGETGDES